MLLGAKVGRSPEVGQAPGHAPHPRAVKGAVSCAAFPQVLRLPSVLSSLSVKEASRSLGSVAAQPCEERDLLIEHR